MSTPDPAILQDFLTEAGELIEQLDIELVELESAAGERAGELLDSIFRALHTVKGAAGFIGLEAVTTFAHAAEDALNRLRRESASVEQGVIDALLRSADVLRGQIEDLHVGSPTRRCPEELLSTLRSIAGGERSGDPGDGREPVAEPADAAGPLPGVEARELRLDPAKADLLEFMAADLRQASGEINEALNALDDSDDGERACRMLIEVGEGVGRTAGFFELEDLAEAAALIARAGEALPTIEEEAREPLLARLRALALMVGAQGELLEQGRAACWSIDVLVERVEGLIDGGTAGVVGASKDPMEVLRLDGVIAPPPAATGGDRDDAAAVEEQRPGPEGCSPIGADAEARADEPERRGAGDRTIRVDVNRLEELLNLVGQLVLTKNQIVGLSRRLGESRSAPEMIDEINTVSGDLDLVTASIQTAVTRTRLQPLAKLFDRYPRVIRDIARATGKQIRLEIEGRETEVDKSVLELLGDPLVHVLRNSADHGIEPPEERAAGGKDPAGTVRLLAEHQGSHVRIAIRDDGRGMDRFVIGRKAVEKGLATEEQVASMGDEEVLQFIFAPGFSTASQVSDLSGRGVGMDVVRTNVRRMNGSINVRSTPGEGTEIEILIPLTIAIMPALEIEVGSESYCIPLQAVVEIVRPDAAQMQTVDRRPVMRLRGSVLPLVELRDVLGVAGEGRRGRFAVVVSAGRLRAGLLVDRLVGQKEIVIKPLDRDAAGRGPFSGATIQEDGRVSLILDVNGVLQGGFDNEGEPRVAELSAM